ncbi:MAG TPA: hypothetical protein VGB85_20055, partial [Nannocystis sp.]
MRAALVLLLTTPALGACFSDPADPTETTGGGGTSSSGAVSFTTTQDDTPTTGDATASATGDATGDALTTTTNTETTATATGDTGDDTTTGAELPEDEALLRKAIAGEVDPQDALRTIADRGGFPVETSTGSYLFACLCGPGEWQLAGAH